MNLALTKLQSRLIAIAIVVLFFALSMFFFKKDEDQRRLSKEQVSPSDNNSVETEASSAGEDAAPSSFALKSFHRSEIKNGKTVWEATGDNARFFPSENLVKIDKSNFLFYSDKDELINLTADKAILHLSGSTLVKAVVEGDVILKYGDKVTIKTKEATYLMKEAIVTAPGLVNIEHEMIDTKGNGLHANLNTEEVVLLRKVKSVIKARGRN